MRSCGDLQRSGTAYVPCERPAVANIGERWYCAEHYDSWIKWYRMMFDRFGDEFCGRMAKGA